MKISKPEFTGTNHGANHNLNRYKSRANGGTGIFELEYYLELRALNLELL